MVPDLRRLARETRAQGSASVNQLVVIGSTLFVGVVVLSQIGGAMPATNSMFSGAMDQVETILGSSIELAAILPLVVIAAALLFWVSRFGNGGGRR